MGTDYDGHHIQLLFNWLFSGIKGLLSGEVAARQTKWRVSRAWQKVDRRVTHPAAFQMAI